MRDDDTDIEALPASVSFRFVSFRKLRIPETRPNLKSSTCHSSNALSLFTTLCKYNIMSWKRRGFLFFLLGEVH